MSRLWRVYGPDLSGEEGASISLGRDESKHVRKVLRLRTGDAVAVFDGDGREWLARITDEAGAEVTLRLESEITLPAVESPLQVALYQGLLRPERMDWVVQKATEIGLVAVHPFASKRADAGRIGPERLRRWRRITVESCKQCGRRRLPVVEPVDRLPGADPRRTLDVVLHASPGSRPLLEACTDEPPAFVRLAVGPQGGFAEEEVESLVERGWVPAGLGPRVLRADTAGIVAAAILLHRWADLGS